MEDVEKAKEWANENNLKPEPITEHAAETSQEPAENPAKPKMDSASAGNQPAPPPVTNLPAEFAAAYAMSDVDVINRLSLNMALSGTFCQPLQVGSCDQLLPCFATRRP